MEAPFSVMCRGPRCQIGAQVLTDVEQSMGELQAAMGLVQGAGLALCEKECRWSVTGFTGAYCVTSLPGRVPGHLPTPLAPRTPQRGG